MKTKLVLLISLSVILFQCATEGEMAKSPLWGVDFSDESATTYAQGSVEQQNAGPKVIYIVKGGSLRETQENFYKIYFSFENGETLELTVIKKTVDCNYHFPGNESENQLVSAVFNGAALDLTESSVAIQPHPEENKLHVITSMRTMNAGDFSGTLTRVPLLKSTTE